MSESEQGAFSELEYPWYAVKVRTRAEDRVKSSLEGKGYRVYLPTRTQIRRYSDRTKKVEAALFPGYLFCSLDIQARLPVLTVPGVDYFVSFNEEPKPVPAAELASIRKALESGLPLEPVPYLNEGERVRVESGPMAGTEGILIKAKGKDRLLISVHLLQRSVLVDIDRDSVVALLPQP